jgi:dTDP-4-amino-4,6-dideoxygalactose transaminase
VTSSPSAPSTILRLSRMQRKRLAQNIRPVRLRAAQWARSEKSAAFRSMEIKSSLPAAVECWSRMMRRLRRKRNTSRRRRLSTQARLPGLEYRHAELGYNYRMSNLSAALGVAQLEQLDRFLQIKRDIAHRYNHGLKDIPGIVGPPAQPWANSSHWMYSILVEKPGAGSRAIIKTLDAAGIECRPLWSPLHEAAYFNSPYVSTRNTSAQLFRTGVSLPCSCGMTPKEQDVVISSLVEQLK